MARGQLTSDTEGDAGARDDLADAFAAFGLKCEGSPLSEDEEFWLWPENQEVFGIWGGLQTQWVVGMAGAFGLNYAGVESNLRLLGIPKKKWTQIFVLIKHMEQAALEEWASRR